MKACTEGMVRVREILTDGQAKEMVALSPAYIEDIAIGSRVSEDGKLHRVTERDLKEI